MQDIPIYVHGIPMHAQAIPIDVHGMLINEGDIIKNGRETQIDVHGMLINAHSMINYSAKKRIIMTPERKNANFPTKNPYKQF
jgi:hypothetical protein